LADLLASDFLTKTVSPNDQIDIVSFINYLIKRYYLIRSSMNEMLTSRYVVI